MCPGVLVEVFELSSHDALMRSVRLILALVRISDICWFVVINDKRSSISVHTRSLAFFWVGWIIGFRVGSNLSWVGCILWLLFG